MQGLLIKEILTVSLFAKKRVIEDDIINESGIVLIEITGRKEFFLTDSKFPDDITRQFTSMITQGKLVIDLITCNPFAFHDAVNIAVLSDHFLVAIDLDLG